MAKKTKVVYRDTKTGRWCKKSQCRKGGKRFKRERVKIGKRRRTPPPVPPTPPPPGEVHEFIVGYSYEASGRSFDVIVTARSDGEARELARAFLARDSKGRRIVKAGFVGWAETVARGEASLEDAGQSEYRDDSEA